MKTRITTLTVAVALLFTGGPAVLGAQAAEDGSARLAALAESYWQAVLDHSPGLRIREGLPVEELPGFSYEDAEERAGLAEGMLEELREIEPEGLSHEEWLTREMLGWQLEQEVAGLEYFWHFFQLTPYSFSFSGIDQVFRQLPIESEADLDRYLRLVGELPRVVGELETNLATRREKGILIPKPEIPAVLGLLKAHAATGAASPFQVADARLSDLPAAAVASFREKLDEKISAEVAPAFTRLAGRLDEAYVAAAPERVGLGQYPGGEAAYRHAVRLHTTLDVGPEEVHLAGLAAVESLEAKMAGLRESLGFPGPRGEAHAALRKDPRILPETPEEVGERLMEPIARIEPRVDDFFGITPEAPYGVERLDPALEGAMTFGYYQWPTPDRPEGLYFYNGSNLEERPLLNAAALIYHELVPGHHFQIALQNENRDLPDFRRNLFPTAFVEGWAEYASDVAGEMGMYEDPWDRYGRLTMDLFLSVRLVVDTGMNHLGWSREMASEYMANRVLESATQIATETLRYSVDLPGQALAYKMGSGKIRELRRHAEEALGDRFDVRRFHDAVLGHGAMPLSILEKHVDWWIEQEKAR